MTPEPGGQSGNPLEEKIRNQLQALVEVKSKKRQATVKQLADSCMSDAETLFASQELLEGPLKNEPSANKLLELLTDQGRLTSWLNNLRNLEDTLLQVNGPHEKEIKSLIRVYLHRPARTYHNLSPLNLENVLTTSTNTLFNFAEALIELGPREKANHQTMEAVVKTAAKLFVNSGEGKEFYLTSLDMAYMAATSFNGDVAEKAVIATEAVQYFLRLYAPEEAEAIVDNMERGKGDYIRDFSQKRRQTGKYKESRFFKLIEGVVKIPELLREGKYYHIKLSDPSTMKNVEPGFGFYYTDPEKFPLGDKYAGLRMVGVGLEMQKMGCETDIVFLPYGGFALAILEKHKAINGKFRKIVSDTLLSYHSTESGSLAQGGIDSIVQYFGPEFDYQKTKERKAELLERVKTGWFALTERGDEVVFRDNEEAWIREMGVKSILFSQKETRTDVSIKWHDWEIKFSFDRNFEVKGLEGMAEEYRDWLTTFVLSYLAEIKNPQKKPTVVIGKSENVIKTEDEPQKPWGRRAHLRVNHIGDTGKLDLESIEKVRFHFGIDLVKLNHLFATIQKRLTPSRVLFPGVGPQEKAVYERFLWIALRRIRAREEMPKWEKEGDKELTMVLKNPLIGVNPNYTISFVKEAAIQPNKLKPMQIECPQVAKEILELSK